MYLVQVTERDATIDGLRKDITGLQKDITDLKAAVLTKVLNGLGVR